MSLNILDIIQLGCEGVLDIDYENLPVGFTFIEQSHDTEDLDLLDLADVADLLADLADVERVVVTLGLGVGVCCLRIFPGLQTRVGVKLPENELCTP